MNLPAITGQGHPVQASVGRYHPVKTSGTNDAFVVGKLFVAQVETDGSALSAAGTVVELARSHSQTRTGANDAQI